jgi:hypothetical protein
MNHDQRDETLGAALRQLPVPDHEPGFWDDLAGRLSGEGATPVVHLDQHRRARRRLVPLGAAAAVVAALLGAGLILRDSDKPGNQVATADRPGEGGGAAAPAMLTADYTVRGSQGSDLVESDFRLTAAADGSFRWTGRDETTGDGKQDVAYDAAAQRAVQIVDLKPDGRLAAYVTTDIPPGGPDQGIAAAEPLGPVADFVVSLGRVTEADHAATGRPVWRYEGPLVEDRLGDGPDMVVAEVDRATGVLLTLRSRAQGTPFRELSATSVETADQIDRSRFQPDIPPSAETSTFSMGFRPASLDEARAQMPYDVLVPEDVPDGFRLDAVAVNRDKPSTTGAEGMNPPVADIVALRWQKGFQSFTLTLRPTSGQEWGDPFGQEGMVYATTPVRTELPGRPALEGELVVDPPSRPHLWGITGDIVVTVDGDLSADAFVRLAD